MTKRLFGTDGVRGVANTELTPELAFKLGEAAVAFLGPRIVIGRDTRQSGEMLESMLSAGIMSAGGYPMCCGVIPTPAVALITRELAASGGVVISASHNPPEYNGIKFFSAEGTKLPDEVEDNIEAFLHNGTDKENRGTGDKVGRIIKVKDARERYINHAVATSEDLTGLKVAVDCGHGAASRTTVEALKRLGAEVVVINDTYDGMDINVRCGSTHLDQLRELVLESGADLGIAHDGDADRMLALDAGGNEIDGDFILAICGVDLKARGKLKNNQIVTTVMCNLGFQVAMKEQGISVAQTKVGDRYVLERMVEDAATLGGEQSGHIIFLDHNTTGDGLITALQLMSVMKRTGKPLEELAKVMTKYPQTLINVKVDHKEKLASSKKIAEAIEREEKELGDKGRVLVRASGTEPLVRVMVEASSQQVANSCAKRLSDIVKDELD